MPRTVPAVVHWVLCAAGFTGWFAALEIAWGQADRLWLALAMGGAVAFLFEVGHDLVVERQVARREGRARRTLFALADRPVVLPVVRLDAALGAKMAVGIAWNAAALLVVGRLFEHRGLASFPLALLFLVPYGLGKALVGDGLMRNGSVPRGGGGVRATRRRGAARSS